MDVGLIRKFRIIGVRVKYGHTVVHRIPFRPLSFISICRHCITPLMANFVLLQMD